MLFRNFVYAQNLESREPEALHGIFYQAKNVMECYALLWNVMKCYGFFQPPQFVILPYCSAMTINIHKNGGFKFFQRSPHFCPQLLPGW